MKHVSDWFTSAGLSLFVGAFLVTMNAGYAALIFAAFALLWPVLGALADKVIGVIDAKADGKNRLARFAGLAVFAAPLLLLAIIAPSVPRDGMAVLLTRGGRALTWLTGRIYPLYPVENTAVSEDLLLAVTLILPFGLVYALLRGAWRHTRMVAAVIAIVPLLILYPLLGLWTVLFFIAGVLFCAFPADRRGLMAPRLIALSLVAVLLIPALLARPGLRHGFVSAETRRDRFTTTRPESLYTRAPLPFGIAATPSRSLDAFAGRYGDGDNIIFTLTMEKPDALYLRHFAGTELTADGWRELYAAERAPFRDLYESYHAAGNHELIRWADRLDDTDTDLEATTLVIRPETRLDGAPLTPYALAELPENLSDPAQISDTYLADSTPSGSYQTRYLKGARERQNETVDTLRTLYLKDEATAWREEEWLLREAHKPYLELPEKERRYLESLYPEATPPEPDVFPDTRAALIEITRILAALEVDEEATLGAIGDRAVTQSILEFNHGGTSAHFATAATMLFRYRGIPARYVEGFVVLPSDVEGAGNWDQRAITADHYHAWCEYYVPGIGFVPYESNPLYREIMPQPERFRSDILPEPPEEPPEDEPDTQDRDPAEAQRNTQDRLRRFLLYAVITVLILLLLILLVRQTRKRNRRVAVLRDADPAARAAARFATALKLVTDKADAPYPADRSDAVALLCKRFVNSDWETVFDAYERIRFGSAGSDDIDLVEDAVRTMIAEHKVRAARIGF